MVRTTSGNNFVVLFDNIGVGRVAVSADDGECLATTLGVPVANVPSKTGQHIYIYQHTDGVVCLPRTLGHEGDDGHEDQHEAAEMLVSLREPSRLRFTSETYIIWKPRGTIRKISSVQLSNKIFHHEGLGVLLHRHRTVVLPLLMYAKRYSSQSTQPAQSANKILPQSPHVSVGIQGYNDSQEVEMPAKLTTISKAITAPRCSCETSSEPHTGITALMMPVPTPARTRAHSIQLEFWAEAMRDDPKRPQRQPKTMAFLRPTRSETAPPLCTCKQVLEIFVPV
jgi:hypothetical protein